MEHDGCVGCKYEHESADSKYCLGCKQNAIDKYAPMTNADRIRSMTDEELAEKLIHKQNGKWICSDMEIFLTKEVAIVHELHWLQSEAEKVGD